MFLPLWMVLAMALILILHTGLNMSILSLTGLTNIYEWGGE